MKEAAAVGAASKATVCQLQADGQARHLGFLNESGPG